jgi:hypothetical protein
MSERFREPIPVQFIRRVVDGWSAKTSETDG